MQAPPAGPIPGLIFGGCLIALGCSMLWAQKKNFQSLSSSETDRREHDFLLKRARRRFQVAGLILIIGIMIPVGDALIPWQKAVATFAIYWIIVIVLALWTILLALADIAATRMHTSIELTRLQNQQQNLERVAQQLREAQKQEKDSQI